MKAIMDEVEKVYNFERDLVTARVQDATFDAKVAKIEKHLHEIGRTYKDPEYLRDPLPDKESAARRMEDKKKVHFEA